MRVFSFQCCLSFDYKVLSVSVVMMMCYEICLFLLLWWCLVRVCSCQ